MTMIEVLMLDIDGVAQRLGVSVATVRRIVKRGELRAYKIGGQLRFKEEEVEAYIDAQLVDPAELDDEGSEQGNG